MSPWALWLCIVLLIGSVAASDVPFVFGEGSSSAASYTSAQLEQASIASPDLAGVPPVSYAADNATIEFPIVGGGSAPGGTTEKKAEELRKLFDSRVEPDNSKVHEKALVLVAKYPGDRTIDQISSIYEYLKDGWHYVGDPRGVNNFFWANETLNVGEEANCAGVGDCGDFAILMSALVESVGDATRIVLASNNTTGGHAYAEVYLGQLNDPNSQVDAVINWLRQDFETDKIFVNINTSTKEVWLNLDWWPDQAGNPHPGGPFFTGDKNIVLYIRGNYQKSPLRLPEKTNKQPKLISLTSDELSPQDAGTAVTWTAEAKDPENDQIFYKFFLNDNPVTKWVTDNTWVWSTTENDIGENIIEVHVRDTKHAEADAFDSSTVASFVIQSSADNNQVPIDAISNQTPSIENSAARNSVRAAEEKLRQSSANNNQVITETDTKDAFLKKEKSSTEESAQSQVQTVLTVVVYDGDFTGSQLSGVEVAGQDGSGSSFEGVTDSDGKVAISGQPGNWHFTFSKEGYNTVDLDYEVTETGIYVAFLERSAQSQQQEPVAPSFSPGGYSK